jgi:hypothetical protein
MSRHRKAQPELRPVYVRPEQDKRDRAAARAFNAAAFTGTRHRPAPGEFDPLHLRQGMRATEVQNRAGWVVSNPLLDQTLVRNPWLDASLPGYGRLRMVYRSRFCDLVCLPGTLAVIKARIQAERSAAMPAPVVAVDDADGLDVDQLELFA